MMDAVRSVTLSACILALCGCSAFRGPRQLLGVARGGSEARHNVQGEVGARCVWKSGAQAEMTFGNRFRVDEPSSRGDSEEKRIHGEILVPLTKRGW